MGFETTDQPFAPHSFSLHNKAVPMGFETKAYYDFLYDIADNKAVPMGFETIYRQRKPKARLIIKQSLWDLKRCVYSLWKIFVIL